MKCEFSYSTTFEKEFKRLLKKYKSLQTDLEKLVKEIEGNPNIGVSLGGGLRKIRMEISSKNKGKSGGSRVITHEIIAQMDKENIRDILLVSIYDKSEYSSVDINIIKEIIKEQREE